MKIIQSRNAREGHYERRYSRTRYYARSLAYKAKEKRRIARRRQSVLIKESVAMNYKRIPQVCGLLFDSEFDGTIHDECGCTLPSGHHEPHEFIAADGQAWQWETDLSCDCESCMEGDGDFCIVYWKKADNGQCEPAAVAA